MSKEIANLLIKLIDALYYDAAITVECKVELLQLRSELDEKYPQEVG